ncbi:hypothetical protein [Nocardia sp. NPDC059239]
MAGLDSEVALVGLGDGTSAARVGFGISPYEAAYRRPAAGTMRGRAVIVP